MPNEPSNERPGFAKLPEFLVEYADEIERIFAEAAGEIAEFPAGLRELGQALLAKSDPMRNGGTTNGICYLLPYWAGEPAGSPIGLCRELAVANIYMMLHFFLVDDAMDGEEGGPGNGVRAYLSLSELFHERFLRRYARHFSSDSPLWGYNRKYLEEWARVVYRETDLPADPRDVGRLAGKAAPVKLCATGLLIGAGREEDVSRTEEAVDLALAVLQLSDDLADWRDDLPKQANANAFLTLVKERLQPDAALDETAVKRAIYRHGCLDRLADIADSHVARMGLLEGAQPKLAAFQAWIAASIRKDAREVEEWTTKLAAGGGFANYLSKL